MNFGIIVGGGSQNQCPSEFGWGGSQIYFIIIMIFCIQVSDCDSLETE